MSEFYHRLPLRPVPKPSILTDNVRRRARIGRVHWNGELDEIPDNMVYKRVVKGYIAKMHEHEANGLGLFLFGGLGTGKTTIGSIILRNALARGGRCLALRCGDMVDMLLAPRPPRLENGCPLMEALSNVNYLLLDDFEEEDKIWKAKKIESVLRARYDECLPTIITTNIDRDKVFEIEWLKSLLFDRYVGVEINGINWRKQPPNAANT